MEKRKWLWKRKSGEKSPGETESSGSISSHSERNSDDQHEAFKTSPVHNTQSPEVTSKAMDCAEDVNESMRKLREKLSAALVNVSAKDDLVKQHAKVAEEAVVGWEKAENEVVALKQQAEDAALRNSALEDRLSHVDGALKECVRQLRQAKEEQDQKIAEAVLKKSREWEANKSELEARLLDLQTSTAAANSETTTGHVDRDLYDKVESLEKENSALKLEILSQSEEIEIMTIERDLSVEAAETASKQHLESIKKVAKLEAECKRLKIIACKSPSVNDHKSTAASSIYVDSITDNQSDSGEQLVMVDDSRRVSSSGPNRYEPSCSDSWNSTLIADLDQLKNEKAISRNITASSIEINLMDDFLEMERLAALPVSENKSPSPEPEPEPEVVNKTFNDESYMRAELEAMACRVVELEEKLQKVVAEKSELEAMTHQAAELEETLQKALLEKAELEETLLKALVEKAEQEAMTYRAAELEEHLQKAEAERSELESMTHRVAELEENLLKAEAERSELESMTHRVAELEESLQKVAAEKAELDVALNKSQESVEALQLKLTEAEMKLEELQREIHMANESKQSIESQLISMEVESRTMYAKVDTLETELQKEKALSEANTLKCHELEEGLTRKQQETIANSNGERKIKQDELAVAAGKLAECQKTIASLGNQLKSLATLEDFLIDTASLPGISGRESLASGDNADWRLHCNGTISPMRGSNASRIASENSGASGNKIDKNSPPSSTSSAVSSSQASSEKNRNGFAKFFTRSKSGIHLEI